MTLKPSRAPRKLTLRVVSENLPQNKGASHDFLVKGRILACISHVRIPETVRADQ